MLLEASPYRHEKPVAPAAAPRRGHRAAKDPWGGQPRGSIYKTPGFGRKVRSLCGLFGCRFADGRAEGAPELRRAGKERQLLTVQLHEVEGAVVQRDGYTYPSTMVDGEAVPEAYIHDERVLPHLLRGDLSRMFPRALPAEEPSEEAEGEDWLEARAAKLRESAGADTCREGSSEQMSRCASADN